MCFLSQDLGTPFRPLLNHHFQTDCCTQVSILSTPPSLLKDLFSTHFNFRDNVRSSNSTLNTISIGPAITHLLHLDNLRFLSPSKLGAPLVLRGLTSLFCIVNDPLWLAQIISHGPTEPWDRRTSISNALYDPSLPIQVTANRPTLPLFDLQTTISRFHSYKPLLAKSTSSRLTEPLDRQSLIFYITNGLTLPHLLLLNSPSDMEEAAVNQTCSLDHPDAVRNMRQFAALRECWQERPASAASYMARPLSPKERFERDLILNCKCLLTLPCAEQ